MGNGLHLKNTENTERNTEMSSFKNRYGFTDDPGAPSEDAYTADEKFCRAIVGDLVRVVFIALLAYGMYVMVRQ